MHRSLLLAKIHSCTITASHLNYMGSISIDETLLDAAGILPYEQVQVVNIANGERFITYAIAAPRHSGAIELNGAAARLGMKGDRIIIMTYGQFTPEELKNHSPTVVLVDDNNSLQEVHRYDQLPNRFDSYPVISISLT
ncbi:aspartate 1-decarboxylase [Argonema galeatum]|uniref:aspartate 1-decarboxylase n=1 Tax=Argonema galeatum TaxID=2942762 RepID=UPI0020118355|nr:aspartate 1-decarboxylase [Argonema galeatum]MCL1467028.1 aspartate 1-decarboxylase [Argonema galeatum A003/A1]